MANPLRNTVTQSNRLIEAAHTLTLQEKRVILLAASMLDPRKPLPKNGFLTIRAEVFAEVFGVEPRHAYQALRDAADRLYERDIRRYKQNVVVERMRWVYHAIYKPGQGCIELGFSPTVVPHLTMLHKEFTSYQIKQIGQLTSFYAIRLYELMSQFLKIKQRECTLEQLREMFDLRDKYGNVNDLRKRVLDPAVDEVNAYTDLRVIVEPRRKGRLIVGFTFAIEEKPIGEQQLEMKI